MTTINLQEQRKDWTPTEIPKRVTVSAKGRVIATYQIAGVKWTPHGWAYRGLVGFTVAPVPVQLFGRIDALTVSPKCDPEPTRYTFDW